MPAVSLQMVGKAVQQIGPSFSPAEVKSPGLAVFAIQRTHSSTNSVHKDCMYPIDVPLMLLGLM